MTALSERKAAILQAVVEGYISTSEPVGSNQVLRASALPVSSATVRSELGALEEAGYLLQPHTSAGRIPSDKGYRYFVDSLMTPYELEHDQQRRVASFFKAAQGELERMLRDTSDFLAQLTHYAAVVVAPTAETSPVRAVNAVRLNADQAVIVVVHANTAIDKTIVSIEPSVTDDVLGAAAALVARVRVDGFDIDKAGSSDAGRVARELMVAMNAPQPDTQAFVGGTSTVAGIFDAVEKVQDVLVVLEKQFLVVGLVKDLVDRGLTVAIGTETGVEPLADCALVVAPVEVDGQVAASIGLLGPSRMHYSQAVATVSLVSTQLGRHLTEGPTP